jgi:integrase
MRRPRTGRPAPAARSGAGRRTDYATHRLNAGAERVDIQALLGHESVATIQIDTHVGQDWMVAAARLCRKNAIRRYSG